MEEHEYKTTYSAINQRRCAFEKAINSRRCACEMSSRFNLADREGVSCRSSACLKICDKLLKLMRSNARFALHLTSAEEPLPHAREIKVQAGGLLGLQELINSDSGNEKTVPNIHGLVNEALQRYENLDDFPYDAIVKTIVRFEGRRKRIRPGD